MEGTLFPNKPLYPIPAGNRPPNSNQSLKFNSTTLPPLPPQSSSSSIHFDSILQHLLHHSSPPRPTISALKVKNNQFPSLQISANSTQEQLQHGRIRKPISEQVDIAGQKDFSENGSLEFLSKKGKNVLYSILEQPLHDLDKFLHSCKVELLQVDFVSLLKALDFTGNWEIALLLFEWS